MSGKVTINGHTYDVGPDDMVLVIGKKVHFNYQLVGQSDMPEVTLAGDPLNVHGIGSIKVEGNVQGDVSTQGSVTCGNVQGSVSTQGSVKASGDCGNINTMGSVSVGGSCKGKISTMGRVTVGKG